MKKGDIGKAKEQISLFDKELLKTPDESARTYYLALVEIQKAEKDFKGAYKSLAEVLEITETLSSATEAKERAKLRNEMDLRQEQLRTELAEQKLEQEKQRSLAERRMSIIILIATIGSLVLLGVFWMLRSAKNNAILFGEKGYRENP